MSQSGEPQRKRRRGEEQQGQVSGHEDGGQRVTLVLDALCWGVLWGRSPKNQPNSPHCPPPPPLEIIESSLRVKIDALLLGYAFGRKSKTHKSIPTTWSLPNPSPLVLWVLKPHSSQAWVRGNWFCWCLCFYREGWTSWRATVSASKILGTSKHFCFG